MINNLFSYSKNSAKSAINYLLSDTDANGKPRPVKPLLIDGDPKSLIRLTDSLPFTHKYTSGALSFRANEEPTLEKIQEIKEQFFKTFAPGIEPWRIESCWVLHKENNGNTALHYVIARVDRETGKSLNLFPPSYQPLNTLFSAYVNKQNNWEQIHENISSTKKNAKKGIELDEDKYSIKWAEDKEDKIIKGCLRLIKDGRVNNRQELIDYLKSSKAEFSRIGKDYVSLKREKRNVRIKHVIFDEKSNYKEIREQLNNGSQKLPSKFDAMDLHAIKAEMNILVDARRAYNKQRYTPKTAPADKEKMTHEQFRNNFSRSRPTVQPFQKKSLSPSPLRTSLGYKPTPKPNLEQEPKLRQQEQPTTQPTQPQNTGKADKVDNTIKTRVRVTVKPITGKSIAEALKQQQEAFQQSIKQDQTALIDAQEQRNKINEQHLIDTMRKNRPP